MSLTELLASVLNVDPAQLTDSTNRDNISTWDSLGHLNVVTALEETYNIEFSTAEINSIKTVGDVRKSLAAKGVSGV